MNAGLLLLLVAAVPPPEPSAFVLATVEGKAERGAIERIGPAWEVRLAGNERTLKATEWTSLRRFDRPLPPHPTGPHFVLTSGDRIPFVETSLALTGEQLSFASPWLDNGKTVRVPLSAIALVWRTAPESATDAFSFRRQLVDAKRRRDAVVLKNGDVLEGTLSRLDPKNVELDINRKTTKIDAAQMAVLAPSAFLATATRPKETYAVAILADGSRFSLRSAITDGKTLTGTTLLGAELKAPIDQLMSLDLLQGSAIYLSDLSPAKYEHTPYFGLAWPLAINTSVAGRALRLSGSVHDRGLGMHSAARVSYALPAGVRFFEARVGLDDVGARKGSVRVRVLVDGQERDLGLKGDLKHGDALDVRIDVKGGRELTLVVDFGEGGDVGDHVNWVDARLIR
jgi:hypothetical protein